MLSVLLQDYAFRALKMYSETEQEEKVRHDISLCQGKTCEVWDIEISIFTEKQMRVRGHS
jgi:hypothetical protein